MEKEFNLSDKFRNRRIRINLVKDELYQAMCHTSFNQAEHDVKEFIKLLIKDFKESQDSRYSELDWSTLEYCIDIIKLHAGDDLI